MKEFESVRLELDDEAVSSLDKRWAFSASVKIHTLSMRDGRTKNPSMPKTAVTKPSICPNQVNRLSEMQAKMTVCGDLPGIPKPNQDAPNDRAA